ncbi:MAG TPA: PAC2 family protein [Thermoleophilaceae bacterium]|nr:PAC2 family protein [Thermoleophilaceae bacterium]
MSDLNWTDRPRLRNPLFVCAFKGWNDAGEAASAALRFLIESFDAERVGAIDPEEYFDFSETRPTVSLEGGRSRVIEWPEVAFHAASVTGADRDLLLVEGPEPSLRWRRFARTVIEAGRELEAREMVTLGALLADVPHTRPTQITGLASDDSLIERLGFERSTYEGPTGIVGVLHDACTKADMPSSSLWAAVPHYVAAAPNPKAALALVRKFEGLARMAVDASALEEAAEDYERQVSAAVASDPDVKAFVERLEQSVDESEETSPPQRIPSADSIARDFQQFLKQRGPEEEG